jgi:hypothetical protein
MFIEGDLDTVSKLHKSEMSQISLLTELVSVFSTLSINIALLRNWLVVQSHPGEN